MRKIATAILLLFASPVFAGPHVVSWQEYFYVSLKDCREKAKVALKKLEWQEEPLVANESTTASNAEYTVAIRCTAIRGATYTLFIVAGPDERKAKEILGFVALYFRGEQ